MSRSPGSWQNGGGKKDFFCCIPDVGVKTGFWRDINGWVYFDDSAVFVFLILMVFLIFSLKGKPAMYLTAITATLSAWFIGLVLDANIDFKPAGFLNLRVLFPILAMGLCILNAVSKKSD